MQLLNALRWTNLALRFFLELWVFAAFAYWGWHIGASLPLKITLALVLFLLVIAVWGMFLSPRARVPLSTAPWVLLQMVIFGAAVARLAVANRSRLALILACLLIVNSALLVLWRE
jgi:hypothetical protein